MLGQHRSTQRYQSKKRDGEAELVAAIKQVAQKHPRWGYRLVRDRLWTLGWAVSRKRVYRLWAKEGLCRRVKRRRRRHKGASENACAVRRSRGINDVWTYDVAHDRTEDNRRLKVLVIQDEYSRECLSLMTRRRITAGDVVEELSRLFNIHGYPNCLRSDNGPEFIAKVVETWLRVNNIGPLYVQPGSPWENGYAESFIARLRDELLDVELFTSVLEAQVVTEAHRVEYNTIRPHSALGGLTPVEFAQKCRSENKAAQAALS